MDTKNSKISKVQKLINAGKTISVISKELDIPNQTIRSWVRAKKINISNSNIHTYEDKSLKYIDQIIKLQKQGYSTSDIAKELGLKYKLVRAWMIRHHIYNIDLLEQSHTILNEELADKIQEMFDNGKTQYEIASLLKINEMTIAEWCNRYYIIKSDRFNRATPENILKVKKYIENGHATKDIAKLIGVHKNTILRWKKEFNLG